MSLANDGSYYEMRYVRNFCPFQFRMKPASKKPLNEVMLTYMCQFTPWKGARVVEKHYLPRSISKM